MRYPIGVQTFEKIIEGDYSNSTELIYKIEALLSDWEELIILIGLKTCHVVTFWIERMTRNPVG